MSELELKCTVFRPNLVLQLKKQNAATSRRQDDIEHLFSYNWRHISIASRQTCKESEIFIRKSITLKSCGPCQRCSMINVNDESGKADQNVFQSIMSLSISKPVNGDSLSQSRGKVYFGEFFDFECEQIGNGIHEREAFPHESKGTVISTTVFSTGDAVVVYK